MNGRGEAGMGHACTRWEEREREEDAHGESRRGVGLLASSSSSEGGSLRKLILPGSHNNGLTFLFAAFFLVFLVAEQGWGARNFFFGFQRLLRLMILAG